MNEQLTVGSLFTGIGGLDLGLERAGMRVIWQSEIDSFASSVVLAKNFPGVSNLGDITRIDWGTVERPDLVCGGFPCQPVGAAGRRLGDRDARWLWPEFARCLRELQPRWVLAENVPGLFSIDSGQRFGEVLGDLAALGFDAEWGCIPAAAVGAPHLRWRVFIVAHSQCDRVRDESKRQPECSGEAELVNNGSSWVMADTTSQAKRRRSHEGCEIRNGNVYVQEREFGNGFGEVLAHSEFRAAWSLSGRDGGPANQGPVGESPGPSGQWAVEPDVGRVAHGIPSRVDRLRGLGNAVVPQVAEVIGRWILNQERILERCVESLA